MESLVTCDTCNHGATAHETGGCTVPRCACPKTLVLLIDEALEAARTEIRAEWRVAL